MRRSIFRPGRSTCHSAPKYRPKLEPLERREVPTNFPAGFSEAPVATGLASATAMEFSPDGRLFVCQQTGQLRVIKNGALLPTPFVTVSTTPSGERGLLGVAFHPDFANNGFVYVYYTVPTAPIHNRVSRFTANPTNPDVALPGEQVILELDNLSSQTNHNGGAIHFGLDGKLYIATGENANPPFAQAYRSLHGKMLRVNPDGSIPPDNPFAASTRARREIWANGFRNPFTFAVQPGTGRIYVNDVGSSGTGRREEINELVRKGNYGWPNYQGYTTVPTYVSPVYAYGPGFGGSNCAVTGGTFFNPTSTPYPPSYVGKYFFADLCGSWIFHMDPDASVPSDTVTQFATNITSTTPVDIKTGPDGKLYYVIRGGGGIVRRIDYAPPIPDAPDLGHDAAELTAALTDVNRFTISPTFSAVPLQGTKVARSAEEGLPVTEPEAPTASNRVVMDRRPAKVVTSLDMDLPDLFS
jgi:glucose/arabinose dehydrogenase